MIKDISEIKRLRKNLGLTQFKLAKAAGVSQSLIAKIEAGKMDPTYSKAKQIFNTIETLSRKEELIAKDIMTTKVVTLQKDDTIKKAFGLMKKYNISQMPVLDNNSCIGIVSESTLIEGLMDKKAEKVSHVMKESPPIVSPETSINILYELIKQYSLLVVSSKGKVKGIITKTDMINKMFT